MDLVLLLVIEIGNFNDLICFNPYFNGSSTSTTSTNYMCNNKYLRFNPYFNGSSTSTVVTMTSLEIVNLSFNPYFNGSSTSTRISEGDMNYV